MPTEKELADYRAEYKAKGGKINRIEGTNELGRPGLLLDKARVPLSFKKNLGPYRLTILFTDTNIETKVGARVELTNDLEIGKSYRFPVQVSDPNFTRNRKSNIKRETALILFAKPEPI